MMILQPIYNPTQKNDVFYHLAVEKHLVTGTYLIDML